MTKIIRNIGFIFVIILFPLLSFSQDLSGVWTGYMYNDTTHKNIHYELAINESNGKASGYSHTTFIFDSIKNIGVKSVKIKIKKDHIYIADDDFIFNNYSIPPPKDVKMYSELTFSENDTAEVLSGNWMTNSTKIYNSVTGTLFLQKKKPKAEEQTAIVTKLTELGMRNKLAFLREIPLNNTVAINESPKIVKQEISQPSNTKPSSNIVRENQTPVKIVNEKNEKENVAVENKKVSTPVQSPPVKKLSPVISQNEKNKNEDIALAENKKTTTEKIKPPVIEKKPTPDVVLKQNNPKPNVVAEQRKNPPAQVTPATKKPETPNPVNQKNDQVVAIAEQKSNKAEIKKPAANIPTLPEKKETPVDVASAKPTEKVENKNEAASVKKESINENQQQVANKNQENEQDIKAKNENKNLVQTPPPAAEIAKREIETIRTVEITQDSVVLSLYDNGTVDGDTVSVLLNGEVVMPRVGLKATAINKTIYLTPEMGDSISVIMYAENLGSLPPNTGLLVIREARRIYEIRFSGDLNKNSKIILLRKKKE
jgi:hypothetical protein